MIEDPITIFTKFFFKLKILFKFALLYSQGYKETQCNKAKFLLLIVFNAAAISLLLDIPVDKITGFFNFEISDNKGMSVTSDDAILTAFKLSFFTSFKLSKSKGVQIKSIFIFAE